jgi:hypothetical protein
MTSKMYFSRKPRICKFTNIFLDMSTRWNSVCYETTLMELSTYIKTQELLATQGFPRTSRNSEIHYRIHESPLLLPILMHTNPYRPILSLQDLSLYYPLTYVLIFLLVSFLLVFLLTPYMHSSSPHSCYMARSSRLPLLHHSNYA